ncbi:MAG: hypothetical protein NT154_13165 [Verrucomicrobia bacterium]|nr:hypothetical protein [Verrucomicrobiota bacterium]
MARQAEEFAQTVVVPLGTASIAQRLAFNDQQSVEVQEGISQQALSLERQELCDFALCRRVALLQPPTQFRLA